MKFLEHFRKRISGEFSKSLSLGPTGAVRRLDREEKAEIRELAPTASGNHRSLLGPAVARPPLSQLAAPLILKAEESGSFRVTRHAHEQTAIHLVSSKKDFRVEAAELVQESLKVVERIESERKIERHDV